MTHPNVLCLIGVAYLEGGLVLAAIYDYSVNGSLLQLCHVRSSQPDSEREQHARDCLHFASQVLLLSQEFRYESCILGGSWTGVHDSPKAHPPRRRSEECDDWREDAG